MIPTYTEEKIDTPWLLHQNEPLKLHQKTLHNTLQKTLRYTQTFPLKTLKNSPYTQILPMKNPEELSLLPNTPHEKPSRTLPTPFYSLKKTTMNSLHASKNSLELHLTLTRKSPWIPINPPQELLRTLFFPSKLPFTPSTIFLVLDCKKSTL